MPAIATTVSSSMMVKPRKSAGGLPDTHPESNAGRSIVMWTGRGGPGQGPGRPLSIHRIDALKYS